MPFSITILLIVSFFAAFLLVIFIKPDLFRDIGAIWGAWIGAAIGYFFGSRPVESLTKKIETVLDDLDDSTERNESILDDYQQKLYDCQEVAENYKEKYESKCPDRLTA